MVDSVSIGRPAGKRIVVVTPIRALMEIRIVIRPARVSHVLVDIDDRSACGCLSVAAQPFNANPASASPAVATKSRRIIVESLVAANASHLHVTF